MRLVFSWDDGAPEDKKLFELHEKYEIPGMFFVPTRNREGRAVLSPEEIWKSESKYVQFGGHTENHTYLTDIPIEEVEGEVVNNKQYLEDVLGHRVDHFCLPGGKYNQSILRILQRYYRTVRTADTMNFKKPSSFLIVPTLHFYPRGIKSLIGNSWRQKSYKQMIRMLGLLSSDYYSIIQSLIMWSKDSDDVLIIWGHSWEIEECNLWNRLDSIMNYVGKECSNEIVSYQEITRYL